MMGKSWRAPLAAAVACWGLVACGGGGGGTPIDDPASVVLNINNTSTGAPTGAISLGEFVRLTWSSANASSCNATGPAGSKWNGSRLVSSSGDGELLGPFDVAGTYSYTLTCSGPGGSESDTKTVVVGFAPQGPRTTLSVSPNPLQTGQVAKLSWTSTSTTGCITGNENWLNPGARPAASPTGGESTGIIAAEGEYSFSLTCSGATGSSTDVVVLTVSDDVPSVFVPIFNFDATNKMVQPTEKTTLVWSSNANSCRADGPWPLGSGLFGGTRPASGSETTEALAEPFPKTYRLTCSYSDGSTRSGEVTITKAPPTAPTVNLSIDGAESAAATVADSGKLTWSATAVSGAPVNCVADTRVNGVSVPAAAWNGARPETNPAGGETVGPYADIAGVPYQIVYRLTCTAENPALPASDSVTVTVNPIVQPACNLTGVPVVNLNLSAIPPAAIRALNRQVSVSAQSDGLCLLCGVAGLGNVIDLNQANNATISVPVALLEGSTSITVRDNNVVYPTGSVGGAIISIPGPGLLSLELLGGIRVETLLNGVPTAGFDLPTTTLDAEVLGLVDLLLTPTAKFFVSLQSPSPFNQVRVTKSAAVGVLQDLNVFNACVIRNTPVGG